MESSFRALVTGASSGIGKAIADLLLARGHEVIVVARRKLEPTSKRMIPFQLDISDSKAVQKWAMAQQELLAGTDLLVNNAGMARGLNNIQDIAPGEKPGEWPAGWSEMIDTNIKGLLHMTRIVLPGMIARGQGHIVNLGSIAGRWVYPKGNIYSATKHAVHALTEALRMDLFGTPIRVTEIIPGMVETEFSNVRLGSEAAAKKVYADMNPLTGSDVAEAVLWAIERPAHVNIQEILIMPTDQAAFGMVRRTPQA